MGTTTRSCPKCGASLSAADGAITCRYCGVEILATAKPVQSSGPGTKSPSMLYLALGLPAVLLGVLAILVLVRHGSPPPPPPETKATPVEPPPAPVPPPATPAPSASAAPAPSPFGEVAFTFGNPGKGPAELDQPRHIAVDRSGDVYIASRDSRRIQHFDSAGKFIDAYELGAGTQSDLVQGLAATYDGHLWATRGGDLLKLALPGGKIVKTVPNQQPRVTYAGVGVDATNTVYATNVGANTFISMNGKLPQSDNVRKLDKNGSLLAAWKDVGGNSGGTVAIDTKGAIYIAEERSSHISVLEPSGKTRARFVAPHGMRGAGIVIDGKGRIVTGGRGVQLYDPNGVALGAIGTDEVGAIALSPKGQLYGIVNDRVTVWNLR